MSNTINRNASSIQRHLQVSKLAEASQIKSTETTKLAGAAVPQDTYAPCVEPPFICNIPPKPPITVNPRGKADFADAEVKAAYDQLLEKVEKMEAEGGPNLEGVIEVAHADLKERWKTTLENRKKVIKFIHANRKKLTLKSTVNVDGTKMRASDLLKLAQNGRVSISEGNGLPEGPTISLISLQYFILNDMDFNRITLVHEKKADESQPGIGPLPDLPVTLVEAPPLELHNSGPSVISIPPLVATGDPVVYSPSDPAPREDYPLGSIQNPHPPEETLPRESYPLGSIQNPGPAEETLPRESYPLGSIQNPGPAESYPIYDPTSGDPNDPGNLPGTYEQSEEEMFREMMGENFDPSMLK